MARPVVDRLEKGLSGRLRVVRLDIHSPAGRALGAQWGFLVTPTFILFDGQGHEVWRGIGRLDPDAIREKIGE